MEDNRITVRGINDDLLKKIDERAKQKKCSRSELIVEILRQYTASGDDFVVNNLPLVIRSMVDQELKRNTINAETMANDIYSAALKLLRIAQKFEEILYPELTKAMTDGLNNQQLLSIINDIDSKKH